MGRKKYGLTEYRFLKYLREARGMGTGASYKPWLLVSDLSSQGRSHRIYWWKTNRVHHLFSDTEFMVFLFLIWADVDDIREQYPLPRQETVQIAKSLGVRHPVDPHSRAIWVVTTDFLVTMATPNGSELLAIAAKPEESLEKISVLKKMEIERRYWAERQVAWLLVTDTEVKTGIGRNLLWIFDGSNKLFCQGNVEWRVFSILAKKQRTYPYVPIKRICLAIDYELHFAVGTTLAALRRMLAWKWITVDLDVGFIQDLPISEFWFGESSHDVRTLHFDCCPHGSGGRR